MGYIAIAFLTQVFRVLQKSSERTGNLLVKVTSADHQLIQICLPLCAAWQCPGIGIETALIQNKAHKFPQT